MCGIAGFIGYREIASPCIDRTLQRMKNRGPDCQQFVKIKPDSPLNVYLLHSRLSIIDLNDRANQPYTIGDYTLIFNGEIYNYVELKADLASRGIACQTDSDTEVLLRYYILYGNKCVDYFEGMWSFAIFDRKKQVLFLSRDRFAEKPLYYFKTDDGIFFASEIKFIKSLSDTKLTVNKNHVLRYLVNGYKSLYKTRDTFFNDIVELPYASNMQIDRNLTTREERYWSPRYTPAPDLSLDEAIAGTRQHLLQSVKIRLRSDVPLAFCLSGGVDSAGLASIASKEFNYDVSTYSIIDSDERYNEYDNIMATIRDIDCKHTLIQLSHENTLERLERLVDYHDIPVATISYLIHSQISEAVARDGCRVVISGTGADEFYTGYYDHFNLHLYEVREDPDYPKYLQDWQDNTGRFVRNPHLKNPELYFTNPDFASHIFLNNEQFEDLLKFDFHEDYTATRYTTSPLRNRMLNELFHEGTRVILHEDDLNSMFNSLENRSPYLDSNLFEFAYSIPNNILIQDGYGKYILRESLKGILNDQVRLDRRKKGFNASINSLIDFGDKAHRDYLLDDNPIFELVEKEKIEKIMETNPLPNSYSKFIFYFLNTKIFLEQNA